MRRQPLFPALLLLLLSAPPLAAQDVITPSSGPAFEVGAFVYGQDRYRDDTELRLMGSAGWRLLWSGVFVEPHVRVLTGLEAWEAGTRDCASIACDPGGNGIVLDELASVWPGVTAGVTFGDQPLSHSLALHVGAGLGDRMEPTLGVRYEGSAPRFGWFIEGSYDRTRWAEDVYDPVTGSFSRGPAEDRWFPAVTAGGRFWLRDVVVPGPRAPEDPGIIGPEPATRAP
ncbi:MAG TPA: hypothetical protein VF039_04990 [Longimicrobiales bacterium]